jgi:hypothetical protein
LKPRLIVLNVVLLATLGVSVWEGRARWRESEKQRRRTIEAKAARIVVPQATPLPQPAAPAAVGYVDVAQKDLFSKDRNPIVIVDPPKVEKAKEMPPLPVIYGVLGLPSGVKALMSEKAGLAAKSVRAGDTVGEFTITALDPRSVTFLWEDKEITKAVEELMDRSGRGAEQAQAGIAAAAAAPGPMIPGPVTPPAASAQPAVRAGAMGGDIMGNGRIEKKCVPGENSPAGAVVDGYRKVVLQTPFGPDCRWVPGP